MKAGDLVVRTWLGRPWWNMLGIVLGIRDDEKGLFDVLWWVDGQITTGDPHYESMCANGWYSYEMEVIGESR